jgi:hypothetical protein
MRVPLTISAIAMLLAACGESAPDHKQEPAPRQSAEQQEMHKLNEMDRAITLKRAIYASGYSCKRIDRSGYVTEYRNLSMWMASCSDKKDWAVFIGPDASVQVRLCKDLPRFGLPPCVIHEENKAPAA